ncbi:unnamed protein product [Clonostachys rhizophaga]|uniref:HNH nuclease domain-containing protein n=1 Tax=Clonostachys rhizophaga TaxID=160324 RepID=A0A9N9YJH5_9HYPO|nr:unnamed protein product [Clonostachys rhizophaga]
MPVLPPLDPPPSTPASQRRYVGIRHPAYLQSEQPLLRFGAIDGDNRDGVDFDIALVASAIEVAHSVPMADEKWFLSNTMDRYGASGSDPQPIDDPSNLITLRRDLRHLFETRRFTLVPKRDIPDKARRLALYVFSPDDNNEVVPLYHNRSPAPLSGIAIEHVFARFAWTIFSGQTVRFFKGMAEYAVLLFDPKTDEIKEAKLRALDVRTQIKIFDAFPKSCSASPRKRQRGHLRKTKTMNSR